MNFEKESANIEENETRNEINEWRKIYREIGLEEKRIDEIISTLSTDFKVELLVEEKEKISKEYELYKEKLEQEEKELLETEEKFRNAEDEKSKNLYEEMIEVKNKNIQYLKKFIEIIEKIIL